MAKTTIELGDRVKDLYTGFTGTAVGRTQWLNGCDRIGIEPTTLRNGKLQETEWFDEQRIELVKKVKLKQSKASKTTLPGGPRKDPVR